MRHTIIVWSVVCLPAVCAASPCPDFRWKVPADMVEPQALRQARNAMEQGRKLEARSLFESYLMEHSEGLWAEGARFAMASLPHPADDPDKVTLRIIDRLAQEREKRPESPYAPWAFCRVGELYRAIGWMSEATATFEQFLETYPDDPLAGGVMVGAGLSFLENGQYLEAALVFRRVVEEPKWSQHHLEAALGLANSTALSQAWKQAHYWYGVVEAERPEFIRKSPSSLYWYGVSELKMGDRRQALDRFLTVWNLHPDRDEAGFALNRIGLELLKTQHEQLALWFFHQAALRYEGREPGRRAALALARWMASYLEQPHSEKDWKALYQRLDALEIFLAVSWDAVLETVQALVKAPEPDVVDEARFLIAQGQQGEGNVEEAIQAFATVLTASRDGQWRDRARERLAALVTKEIQVRFRREAWIDLIRWQEGKQAVMRLIPSDPFRSLMVAEAYDHVGLPETALKWYAATLKEQPESDLKEDVLARMISLAHEVKNTEVMDRMVEEYARSYPEGQWRASIAMILGTSALEAENLEEAAARFSEVLELSGDSHQRLEALRGRAKAYQARGQWGEAIQDYRKILNALPNAVEVRMILADLEFAREAYTRAASLYEGLAESETEPGIAAWAKFRLALCYQQLGKPERAEALLTEVRQGETNDEQLGAILKAAALSAMEQIGSGSGTPAPPSKGQTDESS